MHPPFASLVFFRTDEFVLREANLLLMKTQRLKMVIKNR